MNINLAKLAQALMYAGCVLLGTGLGLIVIGSVWLIKYGLQFIL